MPDAVPRPLLAPRRVGPRLRTPTPSERLLLDAGLLDGDEAASAWLCWRRAGGDVDLVDSAAFALLALLYRNLEAEAIRDRDLPRLKGVYRHTWVHNQRLLRRLASAISPLAAEGIDTLILGGAAVSLAHHHDAGVRRMDDTRILVAPADARRALELLGPAGFVLASPADPDRAASTGDGVDLVGPGGTPLGLCWRTVPGFGTDADLWLDAVEIPLHRTAALAPGPTPALLYACTDGSRRGADPVSWIADAAVILRTARGAIDWERFVAGASRRHLARTAGSALNVLTDTGLATIPPEVIAELAAQPRGRDEGPWPQSVAGPAASGVLRLFARRRAKGHPVDEQR